MRRNKLEKELLKLEGYLLKETRKERKRLQSILNTENSLDCFSCLKRIFNSRGGGTKPMVLVSDITSEQGDVMTLTKEFEAESLKKAIFQHCHKHFWKTFIT